MYKRKEYSDLRARLMEPARRIQVVTGPRQVGKTTMVRQVMKALEEQGVSTLYASADLHAFGGAVWIEERWNAARIQSTETHTVLILDEIQKVSNWSEVVKFLWDQETSRKTPISVVLLGSSALLIQKGLSESLAGRFEIIRMGHWSFLEMQSSFGFNLEQFLVYGGYPGGADLVGDFNRWRSYILDSLIETSISKDILMMARVEKPILLRNLFMLACEYPCRILSYTKMLGQLQDTGNTTTLAHYLDLLQGAGLITGLKKYYGSVVRKRGSSPKLLPMNTALISAVQGINMRTLEENPQARGWFVEAAVGAYIYGKISGNPEEKLSYWNIGDSEVDFVYRKGNSVTGLEVFSGARGHTRRGMEQFRRKFPLSTTLLIGGEGLPLEKALSLDPAELIEVSNPI
ncbi:MAG: ATP-binding protein [Candidatus Sabulitectum sp.]|nr:ATP-binding protein [Candidatus Sabulitectum sp.]